MNQSILHITLVVDDYDKAIDFYVNTLNFQLVEDTQLSATKRWVRIKPPGTSSCCLLLAKADNEQQKLHIGNQTGGRVFLFLSTDDFYRDYHNMQSNGVEFVRPPSMEEYGIVAVFKDTPPPTSPPPLPSPLQYPA